MIEILGFCKHKTAHWEGVLYRAPNGKEYVSNGVYEWELNEKRRASLEAAPSINVHKISSRLQARRNNFAGPPAGLTLVVQQLEKKKTEAVITKEKIKAGLRDGVVRLITDPNMESGTVCQIGEFWFYFGGETAEDMAPEEYMKCVPIDDITNEIFDALDSFKKDGFEDEYEYYNEILENVMEHSTTNIAHDNQE